MPLCFGPWRFREATLTASSGTGGPSVWRETNLWKLSFHMASICTKYPISKNIKIWVLFAIYIYIYCMYIYIYICIIGCKRSVHSMDCGQTTTVLFPSVYPLAIQHPGVVESHHVSYVNHWTKWHCCQIARGFLHLRCGLCDDLGMQLPSLLLFLFQGKRSLKMNVPISNWAICRDINKYTHVLCIWTCSNMDMYLCNICTYTYKGQDAVGVHFSLFLPNSNSLTVSNTLTIC